MCPLNLKLEGLLLHIYYKLGKTIKRTLSDINSDELEEFDGCVLGKKRVNFVFILFL